MSKRNLKPENRSRSVKEKISDWFYELTRKVFYPDGVRNGKAKGERVRKSLFITGMLLIPALNWIVFWLFVNIQSFALAFQDARTENFSFGNFIEVWNLITTPINNELGVSILNTLYPKILL